MNATNWLYLENYERVFAVLEQEKDRWEKEQASRQSVSIENVTDKVLAQRLKSLIEPYTIGFGFNTFQVKSDAYFDLAFACSVPPGDGGQLTSEWEVGLEADVHGSERIFLLNRICDTFLSQGSAWIDTDLTYLELTPELYKPSFIAIHPAVFKQAVFQAILDQYWSGQTYRDTDGIIKFLSEMQQLLPDYQADTYFIRSRVLGEERYEFYACYGQTSPWHHFFQCQSTFFAIDRKLKQIHVFVFAQNND